MQGLSCQYDADHCIEHSMMVCSQLRVNSRAANAMRYMCTSGGCNHSNPFSYNGTSAKDSHMLLAI
jgi:hypothetical protein